MPEYPDVTVYIERLDALLTGRVIEAVRVGNPFVVRTWDPPIEALEGRRVVGFQRLGKRIVCVLDEDLFVVFHLMIAGRLHWKERGAGIPAKRGLLALDFDHGTLLLTEAGSKRRASLHLVRGAGALAEHDPGGLEVLQTDLASFRAAIRAENHTLKRTLTDPRLFSGIGNAYSDEILHRARLSPLQRSANLSEEEVTRLRDAVIAVLTEWTDRLRQEAGEGLPEKVTAFRPEMAVHGKYEQPCPVCGRPIQRIRYAENETDYCPTCQTGGKLLADRGLSRLLKEDWPRTLEELEDLKRRHS